MNFYDSSQIKKKEFDHEIEYLVKEAQTELQQYFLEYGYDLFFIDVNLNYDLDPFIDPYLFESMLHEVDECGKASDGCFFLVNNFFLNII